MKANCNCFGLIFFPPADDRFFCNKEVIKERFLFLLSLSTNFANQLVKILFLRATRCARIKKTLALSNYLV